MLDILLKVLLTLFLALGLLCVPFGLPGTFIILAAAGLYGYATDFSVITLPVTGALLAAALAAEGVEAVAGVVGARRYGSGKLGVVASIVGGILGALAGAPLFFGLGSLPGAFAGAFGGAVVAEVVLGKPSTEALRAGWGTFLGRMAGTVFKAAVAVAMAAIILKLVFFGP